MNLPVIFKSIGHVVKGFAGNGALIAKKYAPEIMIGTGIVGFGLTIFETVKATNKTNDILEFKENKEEEYAKDREDLSEVYTEVEYQKDLKMIRSVARRSMIKTWIPVATTGVASVILVLGGYRVLNGRYVATASAYKLLEAGFERYRDNVRGEFGTDVDWRMLNNIKAEDLAAARKEQEENREIAADNKLRKGRKKKPKTAYQDITSQVFDQYSTRWRRSWTADQVWNYLSQVEDEMDDKLHIQKHLFLNEVYDRLGLPRTPQGSVMGWIITPNNRHDTRENGVSFGLKDMPEDARRAFLSEMYNENIWIRLHFNTDGLIYNMIDKEFSPYGCC